MAAASGAEAAFPASASAQTAGQAASTAQAASPARLAGVARAAAPAGPASARHQRAGAALDGSAQPLTLAGTRHHRRHLRRPRRIAWRMLKRKDWSPDYQFPYLNRLWNRESGWNVHAVNPYSGAWGIPQAVPGSKMSSAGPDWQNSARTQIRWGLRYIRARYNSPRRAWRHEQADGWY